jgi:hypothetical protein
MMRTVLMVLAGVGVVVAVALVIRGSADEPKSSKQALQNAERLTTGAYGCMPRAARRQFDRAVKRYDARFGEVIDEVPDDAEPAAADRALRADPEFNRLRKRARSLLVPYLPRGSEFDKACYDRVVRRYDRRAAERE